MHCTYGIHCTNCAYCTSTVYTYYTLYIWYILYKYNAFCIYCIYGMPPMIHVSYSTDYGANQEVRYIVFRGLNVN